MTLTFFELIKYALAVAQTIFFVLMLFYVFRGCMTMEWKNAKKFGSFYLWSWAAMALIHWFS